jgi:hypothetical protein
LNNQCSYGRKTTYILPIFCGFQLNDPQKIAKKPQVRAVIVLISRI